MSSSGEGGGGRREKIVLSAHHCPDTDLLRYHDSETQILALCSLVPAEKSCKFTCTGQPVANYLDVSSTCRSEEEEEEQQEEEGSVSDWSEEDLSLHFSPSVIHPSEEEESDMESSFKCVDVTMETKVVAPEGEGLKMVPKRQIQLKKKKDTEIINDQEKKLQVILNNNPAKVGGANREVSANELLHPTVPHRPDVLLRQHSMPTSLQMHLTNSGDVDSYRVYKGLVAGGSQGFPVGGNRLQKSFSLDETKTKMASCIIKNVLSKKMQVEQSSVNTLHLKKKPDLFPAPPVDQQSVGEKGGLSEMLKGPVHVVRDMKSLVKNTHNLWFSTATTPETHKPTSFKVIGQDNSPPPSYQPAVGVKGHYKTNFSRGHFNKVAPSHSQSHDRTQTNTQHSQGSKPITSRRVDDVTSPLNQSEAMRGPQTGASPPPLCSSTPRGPRLHSLPRNSTPFWVCPVSLPPAPPSSSSTHVSTSLPTLHPHLGRVSYCPYSYIQVQLQHPPPAPTLHMLRSEKNPNTLVQSDCFVRPCPPHATRTPGDKAGGGSTVTPATQMPQQPPFLCSVQGLLPAQVGSDFLVDITGPDVTPRALLSGSTPCNLMFQPRHGQGYSMDMPPQPQRKILLDPETGQFIQVFLPPVSPAPNTTTVFPAINSTPNMLQMGANPAPALTSPTHTMLNMGGNPAPVAINPAPTKLQMGGNHTPSFINPAPTMLQTEANPAIISVMRLQPTFPSLYTPSCLPFTLHTPLGDFIHRSAPMRSQSM